MAPERPDDNLRSVLQVSEQMLELAKRGDEFRMDAGCGVVFGTMRDMAYKLRGLAEKELDRHAKSAKAKPVVTSGRAPGKAGRS